MLMSNVKMLESPDLFSEENSEHDTTVKPNNKAKAQAKVQSVKPNKMERPRVRHSTKQVMKDPRVITHSSGLISRWSFVRKFTALRTSRKCQPTGLTKVARLEWMGTTRLSSGR